MLSLSVRIIDTYFRIYIDVILRYCNIQYYQHAGERERDRVRRL